MDGSGRYDRELDRLTEVILGAPVEYTREETARQAGTTVEQARSFWRAMGFPDVGDRQAFTAADVEAALPQIADLLERRTLGPRWDRISDRQMEYLAALALHGGRASTAAIARTLGRSQRELSWLRQELIEEGDIYVPKRGQLAMAVPLFNRYVLSHYERTRPESATPLLSLQQMLANADLARSAADSDQGLLPPSPDRQPPQLPRATPEATPDS